MSVYQIQAKLRYTDTTSSSALLHHYAQFIPPSPLYATYVLTEECHLQGKVGADMVVCMHNDRPYIY